LRSRGRCTFMRLLIAAHGFPGLRTHHARVLRRFLAGVRGAGGWRGGAEARRLSHSVRSKLYMHVYPFAGSLPMGGALCVARLSKLDEQRDLMTIVCVGVAKLTSQGRSV
jgi:hypothetical protein